ncbi:MAG: hypothetical protein ACKO9V_06295 [Candidatus Kapaibacterium sp.]
MKNRRWPALVHVLTAFIMMNICLSWMHADPGDDGATEHTAGRPAEIMLASPTLVFPRYDSTLTTRKVRCVWSSVAGAAAYRVVMSMDSSFATVVRDTVLADTVRFFWMPGFGRYHWRVRAESSADTGAWSVVWRMNVPSSVPPARLLAPSCDTVNVTLPVRLAWKDMGSAYQFFVVVARDPLLRDIVADTSLPGWTQAWVPTGLLPDTEYHWCVYGRGVEFGGEASDTCTFVTGSISEVVEDPSLQSSHKSDAFRSGMRSDAFHRGSTYSCTMFELLGRVLRTDSVECTEEGELTMPFRRDIIGAVYVMIHDDRGVLVAPACGIRLR